MIDTVRSKLFASATVLLSLACCDDGAVPSFARQTGMDCTTCHMSWLELTNIGRRFKLGGYQLMKQMDDDAGRPLVTFRFDTPPPLIPLAGALQLGITQTARTKTPGTVTPNNANVAGGFGTDFPSQNEFVLQQMSLFLNGKIIDHVGCFCQFTYNSVGTTTSIDNFEIRAADTRVFNNFVDKRFEVIYGLSLNDNPGMSDVWNTTPVFGWPYVGSQVNVAPIAAPIINQTLQTSAGGLTAYTLLDRTLYLEAGAYHQTDGAISFLHLNVPQGGRYQVDGLAPYYRFAIQHDWDKGHQSIEFGTFGLQPKVWKPATAGNTIDAYGPSDEYFDRGYDAQYQYIYDKHRLSVMFTLEDEDQHYRNGTPDFGQGAANARDHLSYINTKVSYYYKKWYGGTLAFQRTTGSPDAGLYAPAFNDATISGGGASAVNGSHSGSPDTTAYIGELDYLFSTSGAQDHRKSRIILQYTAYKEFNGAGNNYANNGRNASDNNYWWLGLWLMY